jgi:hypothetical protein
MKQAERQRWLLNWLGTPRCCDPTLYDGLVRTPGMRAKIGELELRRRLQMMRAARSASRNG